jgi:hypothetical protein
MEPIHAIKKELVVQFLHYASNEGTEFTELTLLDLCRGLQLSYVDVNAACSFAVQGETVILLEISQKWHPFPVVFSQHMHSACSLPV